MSTLTDKIKKESKQLAEMAEKAEVLLLKHGLKNHHAKVALCLDISGTMHPLYASGKIQAFAEKILALACLFDDDLSIDIFIFGEKTLYAGEMHLGNFNGYIEFVRKKYVSVGGTDYGKAISSIRQHYFPKSGGGQRDEVLSASVPIYVMFVTDGTTMNEKDTINQLIWASYEPIFWQFMAIGASKDDFGAGFWNWINKPFANDFSFLQKLDNMQNRFIDNANFFNVKKNLNVTDEELYELMMGEYPFWVKIALEKGVLNP